MVRVSALDRVVVTCTDVETSLAWYTGALGLAPVRVEEWRAGQAPFPSVRVDEHTIIDLFATDRSGVNVDHVCLTVEPTDLDVVAGSGRFNVVGHGPIDGLFGARGIAPSLYVRAPDGNTIQLRCYPSDARPGLR